MSEAKRPIQGILAEFDNSTVLVDAARQVHKAGYKDFECHSPFPIHGIDEAAGEKRSRVSLIAGVLALCGLLVMIIMQWWTSSIDYKLLISGKPFFSYQAYLPITFAGAVLLAALGSVGAFFAFMNWKFHHPVFYSDRFTKVTDDGFFISILATDDTFEIETTRAFLEEIGGTNIELLEGE
jgi:hypothetical protein